MKKYETLGNLYYYGDILLLNKPLLGIFCSREIPMNLYLSALELVKILMSKQITLVGSWHSNVEKKLLQLRETDSLSNIIIFLAKGIENYSIAEYLLNDFENNKLLIASFGKKQKRISSTNAKKRNIEIIKKADNILFLYIQTGGNLEEIFDMSIRLNKKVFMLDHPSNHNWFNKGASPLSKYNLEVIS